MEDGGAQLLLVRGFALMLVTISARDLACNFLRSFPPEYPVMGRMLLQFPMLQLWELQLPPRAFALLASRGTEAHRCIPRGEPPR